MAYNKRYLLQKIVEVQEIVLQYKDKGVSQAWVYCNIIANRYHISEATFNRYMGINAKEQLKRLQEKGEL